MKGELRLGAVILLLVCLLCSPASAKGIMDFLNYAFRESMLGSLVETEDDVYNRAVDDFLAALDAKDAAAIRALFAPAILDDFPNMDAQIEKLFAAYPGTTDQNLCNGAGESGTNIEEGKRASYIKNRFPMISDGNAFMCQLHLVYEDDWDASQIGLHQVVLMNLDSAYKFSHEDSAHSTFPLEAGLHVLTDYNSGLELRFVERRVEHVQTMDRHITEEEIRAFCRNEANWNYPALQNAFGEPNGVENHTSFLVILYELESTDGVPRYFRGFIDIPGNKLSSASIVGEFEWISKVFE